MRTVCCTRVTRDTVLVFVWFWISVIRLKISALPPSTTDKAGARLRVILSPSCACSHIHIRIRCLVPVSARPKAARDDPETALSGRGTRSQSGGETVRERGRRGTDTPGENRSDTAGAAERQRQEWQESEWVEQWAADSLKYRIRASRRDARSGEGRPHGHYILQARSGVI